MSIPTITPLFPSLLGQVICEDYHTVKNDFIEWVCFHKTNSNSSQLSNFGGWQSSEKMGFKTDDVFAPLLKYILSKTDICVTEMIDNIAYEINGLWVNINTDSDFNITHTHPNADISGVFWVKSPEDCGNIVFENPCSFERYKISPRYKDSLRYKLGTDLFVKIKPEEGKLILFPSDLRHYVEPNFSGQERISIAFNLLLR